MDFSAVIIIPLLAVILDSVLGDPHTFPHPVRFIGNGLDLYEDVVRRIGLNMRFAGWLALFLFAGGSWAIVAMLISIPALGFLIAVYFGYSGLALGCLLKECRKVALLINQGDTLAARNALGMLVSRDTSQLDENELRQTLSETVSENLNDGFVVPFFYLALLGPAAMWAYKAVSTMDSMWGYRTEKYADLGYAGAKTDDFLAFIPARLTALVMLWVGRHNGLNYAGAKAHFQKDAIKMESPNAGWPMATAAWLVGGQMGGKTRYFGKVKDKPILGPVGKRWTEGMIESLFTLCRKVGYWSAAASLLAASLLRWAI